MWRGLAVVVVVSCAGACAVCPPRPPPPPGMSCRGDAECVAPFFCRDMLTGKPGTPADPGTCTGRCQSSAECRGGFCDGGECEPSLTWQDLVLFIDERPAAFEVAPWVNFGGGARSEPGGTTGTSAVGAGVEGTFPLHGDTGSCRSAVNCPAWLPRLGPWAAVESTFALARPHMDGGLAFDLGGPRARSWSTFGARVGVGRGESATDLVGQLSWGVRFVQMRSQGIHDGGPCRAIVAPVTGLRLYAAARRELGGAETLTVTFGLEWRPFGRRLGLP